MAGEDCGKRLVDAIGEFEREYRDDSKFGDLLPKLDDVRKDVEDLIPSVKDKPEESPGRRDAREIAEQSRKRSYGRDEDRT